MSDPLELWDRIEPILDRALELPADEQAAYVEASCAGDAALADAVRALLAAEREAGAFLETPPALATAGFLDTLDDRAVGAGTATGARIGRYRLLEEIGSGGMSRVYLAERVDEAYEQKVALKVMRLLGVERDERDRRFRAERQTLAALEHPGIARILDGGTTEDGRQYLAMELVDGVPLDRHCEEGGLGLQERLTLFIRVCEAVHYAHQRLIVHRDLKPSNILVTAGGDPKLLDFGIAKLLADEDRADAPRTRTGLLLMTPEYAAPEQIRGEAVTTATDLYALGVMLYELLTGARPFDLDGKSPSEIEEIVSHHVPEAPSSVARRTPVGAAWGSDLDSIVQKALEKEPQRRYGSAAELADDLGRLLSGHPVRARPATRRYRLTRFVRRHRWGVAAMAALLVTVLGAVVALALEQRRTLAERDRAQLEAAKAEQIAEFLRGLFEASDPAESGGEEITAHELLARGLERADRLSGDPQLQAEMIGVIGTVYRSLGSYEVAERQLRRALEIRAAGLPSGDPRLAEARSELAWVLTRLGEYEEAEALFESALADLRAAVGEADPRTLAARNDQAMLARVRGDYVAAGRLFEGVLAAKEAALGEGHESVAATLADFADLLVEQGRNARAEELLQRAGAILDAALGPDHPRSLIAQQRLARAYLERGDYDAAERLGNEIVELQRRTLGPEHPEVANTLNSTLAAVHYFRGDYAAAEATYREIVAIRTAAFGPEHPDVAIALGNLSMMLVEQGRVGEGERMAREVLALKRRIHEPGHASIASSLHTLAIILQRQGALDEADALLREALAIRIEQLGSRAPRVASVKHDLAVVATERGRYSEAEALFLEALAIRRETQVADHPHIWADLEALAQLYDRWKRPDRAAEVRRELADLFPAQT